MAAAPRLVLLAATAFLAAGEGTSAHVLGLHINDIDGAPIDLRQVLQPGDASPRALLIVNVASA